MHGANIRCLIVAAGFAAAFARPPALRAAQNDTAASALAPIIRTERVAGGVVRVVYGLNAPAGALVAVSLEVSNDGGQTFDIVPRAVTGDVGPGVSPGREKTIVWDSAKDIDDLQIERLVYRVRVIARADAVSSASPSSSPTAPPSTGTTAPDNGRGAPAAIAKKGGLSKGAIAAITGGAAAGGVGIAVAKGKGSSPAATPPATTPPPTTPTTTIRTFRGTVTGPITFNFTNCLGRGPGSQTEDWTFTLTIAFTVTTSTGAVSGSVNGGGTRVLVGGCPGTAVGSMSTFALPLSQVTGTTSRVTFSGTSSSATRTDQWTFTGAVEGDVLSGTLEYTSTLSPTSASGAGNGSARFAVNFREQ